ncbi:MAG: HD domain-containing protein [bacterium]
MGGEKLTPYSLTKRILRKQVLSSAVAGYFGADSRRISHARRTADYAEMILTEEPLADPDVVMASALLHDIGIKIAEEKYGSAEARYQEVEGPAVAGEILRKLEYSEAFICEVCDIIGHHHHPRIDETVNFKVLYDADQLVNAEENGVKRPWGGAGTATSAFLTEVGARIAKGDAQER